MKFKLDDSCKKPTEKQLELIKDMEELCREQFDGETAEEASEYIDRNIQEFKLNCMDKWQLSYL